MTVLLDFYAPMLTEKQRDMMSLYFEQDLSLGEIAEETGVTRQGVLGCIEKSSKKLKNLERELCLVRKRVETLEHLDELEALIVQCEPRNERVMADIEDKIVEMKRFI